MRKALPLLLAIEALGISLLAAILLVLMIVERPTNVPAAIFELVFAAVVAVVLWFSVKRRAFRSAVILLNIIALPISRTLAQGDRLWIALPVAGLAIATLVALFLDRKSLS